MCIPFHKRSFAWLSLLFSLFALNSSAQDPYFDHYTEDNELPSNQVYGMVQDKNNILYFNTDQGVAVFDGYGWKTLTKRDNLIDNCILRIHQDRHDRIWFTSIANTCNYYENGKVYTAPFNEALRAQSPDEHYVQRIFVSETDEIFISFDSYGLYRVDSNNLKTIDNYNQGNEEADLCVFKTNGGYYVDQLKIPPVDPQGTTRVEVVEDKIFIQTTLLDSKGHHRKEIIELGADEFLLSFERRLFHFKNKELIAEREFDHTIYSLYYDPVDQDIWVGINQEGAYQFGRRSISGTPKLFLNNRSVTSILRDHEHNYWFTVNNNGIYRTNNLNFQTFTFSDLNSNDNQVKALAVKDDSLYIGTNSGKLFVMGPNDRFKPHSNYKPTGEIRKIISTDRNSILIFSHQLTELNSKGQKVGFKELDTWPYAYHELDSRYSLLSITPGIKVFDHFKEVQVLNTNEGFKKVRQIFKDHSGTIWLSSQPYGIYTWIPDSMPVKPDFQGLINPKNRSLDFAEIRDHMILAPSGDGILVMGKTIRRFTMENGLSNDIVNVLFTDGDTLWTASSSGLDRIEFSQGMDSIIRVDNYDTRNGLPSNRVSSIVKYNGNIWVGTGKGLVKLNDFSHDQDPITKPLFTHFSYNSTQLDSLSSRIELPNRHPYTILVGFKSISFHQPHKIVYHYRMEGIDKAWNTTTGLEIAYHDLGSGTYTLKILAANHKLLGSEADKFKPDEILDITIIIPKKIHETPLFKAFIILCLIVLIYLSILLILRSTKNREQNKQRLLQAEKKALLSQMNPHFIFNSLNSIQHYIIQQDADNANLYLAKFSQLIRKILDNSKKRQISLGEEIETLMLYLNLEKLRFEDNFDFDLTKSKDLDQNEIMIPPMLIQPFVENAIWHGLMPLKGKGLLKIKFIREGNNMVISVIDNGVGRAKSAEKKRISGHTPTGLKNVNERLSLLNKTEDHEITCKIIDLTKPDGTACGTHVELTIAIYDHDEKRKP